MLVEMGHLVVLVVVLVEELVIQLMVKTIPGLLHFIHMDLVIMVDIIDMELELEHSHLLEEEDLEKLEKIIIHIMVEMVVMERIYIIILLMISVDI